ncbi:MAG TPA: hypothetical protein VMV50_02585 [Candidatus Paceibacterota bacterium]|nr:hypothetical protein [Candidatus Paceibacterota bacterium]
MSKDRFVSFCSFCVMPGIRVAFIVGLILAVTTTIAHATPIFGPGTLGSPARVDLSCRETEHNLDLMKAALRSDLQARIAALDLYKNPDCMPHIKLVFALRVCVADFTLQHVRYRICKGRLPSATAEEYLLLYLGPQL